MATEKAERKLFEEFEKLLKDFERKTARDEKVRARGEGAAGTPARPRGDEPPSRDLEQAFFRGSAAHAGESAPAF